MRKLLFVVNVLLAIAVIAAAVTYYWVFYRALPQSSGTVETQVSANVTVDRDALGVPHIKAQNFNDVYFVEGYSVAEDRMWQMDMLRRVAAGDISEVVGAPALDADREARRMRMRRTAENIYAVLPADERAVLAAYTRGVNAYIETHHGRYGMEFTVLGYQPRLWTGVDSILCGLQMYRTLTSDWRTRETKAQLLRGGNPAKVALLYPLSSDAQPGSNAWAVSGSRTASGKPLLSNDMHLEFSLPGIWHVTHLQAPGMNVEGVELPGLPGVIVGHNDHIAWGVTNLGFTVQELVPINGRTEQARQEHELIGIKDQGATEYPVLVTRYGPVFQQDQANARALRWTASDPTTFHNIFTRINRARNWDEFQAALAQFGGPAQNFVYADDAGNIGYHVAGKLPIRNANGDWTGYIPFEQLPTKFNPPEGYIVTANQNPFPADYPYPVSGNFAPYYRSKQIMDMIPAKGMKPEDSLRIQKDVYSGFHRFLGRQLVKAVEAKHNNDGKLTDAVAMLRAWDGQMDLDHAEPLITTLAFQNVRKAIAESASPGNGNLYDPQISSAVVERILRERPTGWFASYDDMLVRAFSDAVEKGGRLQGADPKRWKWGKYMYLDLQQPIGSRLPLVGSYFNIGPVPISGGSTTVKQTTRKLGPSERMTVSLGNWDESLMNLPVGESGHRASSHYKDQWDAYYAGRSFPMQFNKVDAKSTVIFRAGTSSSHP